MVRLIAPILSYTAEEIWQSSERLNNQEESIFLSNYDRSEINEESIITKSDWNRIFEIKNDVNQSIEEMRNENQLKGSLDANVYIEANKNDIKILEKLGAELHFLFICSETNLIESNNFKITVKSSDNQKCTRCWHRQESVGTSKKHPDLCNRCIENVDDEGEKEVLYKLSYPVLIILLVVLDLFSKDYAANNFLFAQSYTTFIPFIDFLLIYNSGIAFGIFDGYGNLASNLLLVITIFILIYLIRLLVKEKVPIAQFALSLITAGALGNIIDRFIDGKVTDFLHLELGSFSFFIFNLADAFITIGAILIIYFELIYKAKQ